MADVTVRRLEDFESIWGGFLRVRAGLGVSSLGLGVMELPAGFSDYPEHEHGHDSQEEVYTVLEGSATLRVGGPGGEEFALVPGVWARVGPGEKRKITTDDEPARVLAIGAPPGMPYAPPEFTEEGTPAALGHSHD
jgi:mannose-6-phosphate isomerase-like protein (cupin superfamily)